jgi:hypothetical protein
VFGQESALREFSAVERHEHGVSQVDIRGFRFEEFVRLVEHHHANSNRGVLLDIYRRVTAGRASGLFVKLAQSLARASSIRQMSELASRPAEEILATAEQQRFARLSRGARGAAEKLLCFALPFRRNDAEQVFPDENVGAAIRELLTQGLLRAHDGDSFEMHETVRAGLEGTIASNVRRSAHQALAAWYRAQGFVTAEILHLDKAGQSTEAHKRARETFLRGERWAALSAYVTGRKLVSASEAIDSIAGPIPVDDKSLLSGILRDLGEPVVVDNLVQTIQEQPERFYTDSQWSRAVVQAIFEFDPARLDDLIHFAVEKAPDLRRMESPLSCLKFAVSNKNGVVGPRTIEFFDRQTPEIKRLLLDFLLFNHSRESLRRVFQFLDSNPEPPEAWPGSLILQHTALQIRNQEDAVEFLEAMPDVHTAAMLTARSPLLGSLGGLVASQGKALRQYCVQILREGTCEQKALVNAIRVLVFLAEPSICTLCDPLLTRNDAVSGFARLVPALVPAFCDRSRYEARLLDSNAATEDRVAALFVLAWVRADLGDIFRRLTATERDPQKAQAWDFWFLAVCAQAPFQDAIPLLERFMSSTDERVVPVLTAALAKLSELPVQAATMMLIRALDHASPKVRLIAAVGLGQRRSRSSLARLIAQYARENVEEVSVALATAIVASGPTSVADMQGPVDTPATQLWGCILAMRLRDKSTADRVVRIANDPTRNWQLRRAAISAAGRMPYETALERIRPVVIAERSPLTIDKNQSFLCHAVMSSVLLSGAQGIAPIFARGRAGFVDFFADVFEVSWKGSMFPQGVPSGTEAAGWLFDRLLDHGWPAKRKAPDLVLNELNIPMLQSAVLRSLRFCGRPDLIEEQLAGADHVWFAVKCLLERSRAGIRDLELASRLKSIIEASPWRGNPLLHRIIDERGTRVAPAPPSQANVASQEASVRVCHVSYDDAVRTLFGASADFKAESPLVLGAVTAEQCERLIRFADPANDRDRGVETYVPLVQFTSDGYVVARRQVAYRGAESTNALLRPAIAAGNRFGLPIPWHEEVMTGVFASGYVPKYLACLAALNDSDRFYAELAKHEGVLVPHLCKAGNATPVLKYVDVRIIPFLARHVSSGTDEIFEGLCTLALRISTPEIDGVLAGLFYKWTQRFNLASPVLQHDENHALWRGFNRLSEHPRFNMIEEWQPRLAEVLRVPMSWWRAENVVRVLERDPRSYILIESRLFRTVNWEHFHRDEIDRLDDAADRLFNQILEPCGEPFNPASVRCSGQQTRQG